MSEKYVGGQAAERALSASEEIAESVRAIMRIMRVPDYHPGKRYVLRAVEIIAAYPGPEMPDESAVLRDAAAKLGISEELLKKRLDDLVRSSHRHCPEDYWDRMFPEGELPDRGTFIYAMFAQVYARMGRRIWSVGLIE